MNENYRRSEAKRLDRNLTDSATHWDDRRFPADPMLVVARVLSAVPVPASWGRWRYTCEEAWMNGPPLWTASNRPAGRIFDNCFSISELSNGLPVTRISYGVSSANLLGSFVPKAIPLVTYVVMTPHRTSTGALVWLIINTQAIDGTCVGLGGGADLPVHPGP